MVSRVRRAANDDAIECCNKFYNLELEGGYDFDGVGNIAQSARLFRLTLNIKPVRSYSYC